MNVVVTAPISGIHWRLVCLVLVAVHSETWRRTRSLRRKKNAFVSLRLGLGLGGCELWLSLMQADSNVSDIPAIFRSCE